VKPRVVLLLTAGAAGKSPTRYCAVVTLFLAAELVDGPLNVPKSDGAAVLCACLVLAPSPMLVPEPFPSRFRLTGTLEDNLRCEALVCVGVIPDGEPVAVLLILKAILRGVLAPDVGGPLVAAAEAVEGFIIVDTPAIEAVREVPTFPLPLEAPGGTVVLGAAAVAAKDCNPGGKLAEGRADALVAEPC